MKCTGLARACVRDVHPIWTYAHDVADALNMNIWLVASVNNVPWNQRTEYEQIQIQAIK